ncbi:hypothetical protein TGGT1_411310, partial [Toxoplasma gondii GT1]
MTCCRYPSESECPAWDAWTNPVAEANDPSSLVSEYAACGVWRPHTVLPFSRMSLVAYLRGWVRGYWLRGGMRGWAVVDGGPVCLGDGRAYCPGAGGKRATGRGGEWCVSWQLPHHVASRLQLMGSPRGSVVSWRRRRSAGGTTVFHLRRRCSARSDIPRARSVDVLRLAAPQVAGWDEGVGVVDGGPGEKCFAVCDWQVSFRRGCSLTASESSAAGGSQRSVGTLAGIVDVLGVAAPHGPGVVWYATRRVHAR